jgi:hypothetical protein
MASRSSQSVVEHAYTPLDSMTTSSMKISTVDEQTLDQNGTLGWGRWVVRNGVPKESRATREEALAGMRESTYFEYDDDVSEEDDNESDDAGDED